MKTASNRLGLAGFKLIVAVLLGAGSHSPGTAADKKEAQPPAETVPMHPPARTPEAQATISPQQALAKLRSGNARFIAGISQVRNLPAKVRATSASQYPFAVIVSCVDSRQPVELIFDQGIGDVFNARIAGNVLNDDIAGSLEFACKVSGAKLILVLGHSNCGAIKGAVDGVELGKLTGLLAKIKPAIAQVPGSEPRTSKNSDFVEKVAEANVHLVMAQIRQQSSILREMLDEGKIGVVGGMYELSTGEVHFFEK
jgi:Carbonic anhydrase